MGFVLLGVFAQNGLALQGTVVQLIAHGLSIGALFMLAGAAVLILRVYPTPLIETIEAMVGVS